MISSPLPRAIHDRHSLQDNVVHSLNHLCSKSSPTSSYKELAREPHASFVQSGHAATSLAEGLKPKEMPSIASALVVDSREIPAIECKPELLVSARIEAQRKALDLRYEKSRNGEPLQIVVVPSMTDERHLWEVLASRKSKDEIIMVVSEPIEEEHVRYALGHCTNAEELRDRVSIITLNDSRRLPVAVKLLESPSVLDALKSQIIPEKALIHTWAAKKEVHQVGEALGVPVEGPCAPELDYWGTKSGGRRLFEEVGLECFDGVNDIHGRRELVDTLLAIMERNPEAKRCLVKMNKSVSGRGNAVFNFPVFPADADRSQKVALIEEEINTLDFPGCPMERFDAFIEDVGCVVELFAQGKSFEELTAMVFIHTDGRLEFLATHGQFTDENMAYQGGVFPAPEPFRGPVEEATLKVGKALADKGAVGYFGVDYLLVEPEENGEQASNKLFPLEINLRQVGSTHGLEMAKAVTDSEYCLEDKVLKTKSGVPIHYWVSDHVMDHKKNLKGMQWSALHQQLHDNGFLFDEKSNRGVVFHNLNKLKPKGRLGLTAIGTSAQEAEKVFQDVTAFLKSV